MGPEKSGLIREKDPERSRKEARSKQKVEGPEQEAKKEIAEKIEPKQEAKGEEKTKK